MTLQGLSPVSTWRQSGRVSLWRYTENVRNYPGWNLNVDAAGCRSLLELLDALTTEGTGGRTITVTPPTSEQLRVPNNRGGAATWLAPEKWYVSLASDPGAWNFPPDTQPAVLALGSNWLAPLRAGIAGTQVGIGDQSIGDRKRGLALWLWW
ncbi:hypothetical protein [Lysobacter auxotrophicus]|uniref:Uncharacterized protein n=1 Tax=Lysobacter auxotrophicus TaxID=2992573 RepID=A0ABM8DD68_9GAMM|nr:hypothetical protein [Lysobacter auxotrophicus]BDU16499.1 hypothetical protein LA521A_17000 [Lysobacter auxotrophicus]